jgi:DNA-binding transcriptional LysR family regulator
MDNRAGEIMVFVRCAEAGSFSETARAMLMTPSTVSMLIARLEARFGIRLIEQSTRWLVLTSGGEFYYEGSRLVVSQIDETEQLLAQGNAKPEGLIGVSSTVTFGLAALEPVLAALQEAYPGVVVDLSLFDEMVDLYLDRTDVAISLPDSTLMARPSASS